MGSEELRNLRLRKVNGGIVDRLQSATQLAHPLEIEDLAEYGIKPFGLELPRLERVPVPEDHPAKPYLECRSHDAGVFSFAVEGDQAKLLLNDYDGCRLAEAYAQKLGRYTGKSMCLPKVPVQLAFNGLREFAVFQYEIDGKLVRLKHSLRSNLSRISSLDVDWVIRFDPERIELILELRVSRSRLTLVQKGGLDGTGNVWHDHNLLICLGCKEIEVEEGQRNAWLQQFGAGTTWIWDEYMNIRHVRLMPGWNDFVNFLEEIGA